MDTKKFAQKIRIEVLNMTNKSGGSHIGSVFSLVDIITVLYEGKVLNVDPQNSLKKDRDRFILSKGHGGAGIYAVLAHCGFFPLEKLQTYYQNGSDLSGHVSHKNVPGVELSTGSLGHGLPVAVGMAMNAKRLKRESFVYVLVGDGEIQEGTTWESALSGAHHKLDNLVVIVDYNKLQGLGTISSVLGLEPLREKWESFGWNTIEVDGHDHDALKQVFEKIKKEKGKPHCIIAHTIKGKGVSFMEQNVLWHYRSAKDAEYNLALKELQENK